LVVSISTNCCSIDLVAQLFVVLFETFRLGHRLRITGLGIQRTVPDAVDLLLRLGSGSVNLGLRLQYLIELRTGGRRREGQKGYKGRDDGGPPGVRLAKYRLWWRIRNIRVGTEQPHGNLCLQVIMIST
jgi:hypothetical protein